MIYFMLINGLWLYGNTMPRLGKNGFLQIPVQKLYSVNLEYSFFMS